MKARKIATIASVVVAVPVGLLVLAYLLLTSMPTGLPEARERAAGELELVAKRSARGAVARAPAASSSPAAVPAAELPKDYYGACDLALRSFVPGGPQQPPTMLSFDMLVGSAVPWSSNWQNFEKQLPRGGTPQDWLRAFDPAQAVGEAPKLGLYQQVPGIQNLDLAEQAIYASDWEIPPFEENWPAGDGGGAMVLATAAQSVLLRAAARGEAEKVERYLPRCLELSLRAITDGFGSGRGTEPPTNLLRTLALLSTQIDLPESVWAQVADRIAAERLTDAEIVAYRKAFIFRQGEVLKRRLTKLPREQNTLHFFWNGRVQEVVVHAMAPVVRGRLDAYAAALVAQASGDRSADRYLAWRQLQLAQKASDLNVQLEGFFQTSYEHWELPALLREEFPDLYLPNEHPNTQVDWATVVVAAIRHRVRTGKHPVRFEELMPELLPDDFPRLSHAAWYLSATEPPRILRFAPIDGFGPVTQMVYPYLPADGSPEPIPTPVPMEIPVWVRNQPDWSTITPEVEAALRKGPISGRTEILYFPPASEKARVAKFLGGS